MCRELLLMIRSLCWDGTVNCRSVPKTWLNSRERSLTRSPVVSAHACRESISVSKRVVSYTSPRAINGFPNFSCDFVGRVYAREGRSTKSHEPARNMEVITFGLLSFMNARNQTDRYTRITCAPDTSAFWEPPAELSLVPPSRPAPPFQVADRARPSSLWV